MNQPRTRQPKSLIAKLAEACNAVGGVEKKGKNEHHGYRYVKAADVAKAIRHELFKRSVILTSNEVEIDEKEIPTNSGGTTRLLKLKVEYTLRDGDSSDTITSVAWGVGIDHGDKALYKAKTGALKYFLRGLGIIPDEKDDPEADAIVDEDTDPEVMNVKPKRGRKTEPINEVQARAFNSACLKAGKTTKQVDEYLRAAFNVIRIADLAKADFNDAIKWALGLENMAKTLETSVAAAKANGSERTLAPIEETA